MIRDFNNHLLNRKHIKKKVFPVSESSKHDLTLNTSFTSYFLTWSKTKDSPSPTKCLNQKAKEVHLCR